MDILSTTQMPDYKPYFRVLETELNVTWEFEYRFLASQHRFDAALPCCKIAIEVEGGQWAGGGHTRGSGFARDMWKYNQASLNGWRILRFTPKEVKDIISLKENRTMVFYETLKAYFAKYPCTHRKETILKRVRELNYVI